MSNTMLEVAARLFIRTMMVEADMAIMHMLDTGTVREQSVRLLIRDACSCIRYRLKRKG